MSGRHWYTDSVHSRNTLVLSGWPKVTAISAFQHRVPKGMALILLLEEYLIMKGCIRLSRPSRCLLDIVVQQQDLCRSIAS